MKVEERKLAREMREDGLSINEIYRKLGVAKSSVSLWVRDISLSEEQLRELSQRGQSKRVIEKRRSTRLRRESDKRQIIIDEAAGKISRLDKKDLFLLGVALYWGEGSKTKRNVVEFSNTDPAMIRVAMRFFREVCDVLESKFRGRVLIHSHLSEKEAVRYWASVSGIPKSQFYKVSHQQSKASKRKRDKLLHGTFSIYVCDTELFLKIKGWTQGIIQDLE